MKAEDLLDVIVIGGGAAGLAAAGEIVRAGRQVALLEAREYLGGRIHTARESDAPLRMELGAEFIHGTADAVWDIVAAAGLHAVAADGEQWLHDERSLSRIPDFWERIGGVLDSLGRKRLHGRSYAEVMGPRRSLDARLTRHFVEGFEACRAEKISAKMLSQSHREAVKEDGYTAFRIVEGYDRVVEHLRAAAAERTDFVLAARVTEILWKKDEVTVRYLRHGTPGALKARKVLVTVPPAVLAVPRGHPSRIEVTPDIPEKRSAAERIGTGPVVKVVMRLRGDAAGTSALFDARGMNRMSFVHSLGAPIATWWRTFPLAGSLLVGWAGGPAAEALSPLEDDEIEERALGVLRSILRVRRAKLEREIESIRIANWQRDPFSLGAYSYPLVGGEKAPEELAAPIDRTIFFAGEATAAGGIGGTVGSALESGLRAAKEILRRSERREQWVRQKRSP